MTYDHVTIYWLPSNGAITQCGRKAHAIKAGRTSRVQQSGRLNQTLTGHGYHGEYYYRFNILNNPTNCFCSGTPILQSRDHIIRDCPMYDEGRSALLTQFPRLQNPRFQLSSLFRRDRQPHLIWWLKKSGAFTKRGIPWEEIPTDPHDPGPSAVINEAYELPD